MTRETYTLLENFMLQNAGDSAHDREHIYRVLYNALAIARTEENVDYDILIAACLLHDVGRPEQTPRCAMRRWAVKRPMRFCWKTAFQRTLPMRCATAS